MGGNGIADSSFIRGESHIEEEGGNTVKVFLPRPVEKIYGGEAHGRNGNMVYGGGGSGYGGGGGGHGGEGHGGHGGGGHGGGGHGGGSYYSKGSKGGGYYGNGGGHGGNAASSRRMYTVH